MNIFINYDLLQDYGYDIDMRRWASIRILKILADIYFSNISVREMSWCGVTYNPACSPGTSRAQWCWVWVDS